MKRKNRDIISSRWILLKTWKCDILDVVRDFEISIRAYFLYCVCVGVFFFSRAKNIICIANELDLNYLQAIYHNIGIICRGVSKGSNITNGIGALFVLKLLWVHLKCYHKHKMNTLTFKCYTWNVHQIYIKYQFWVMRCAMC